MAGQVFLECSPCCIPDFCPYFSVKSVSQMLCSAAGKGGDGVVHSVQVDGLPEHLLCLGGRLFSDIVGLSTECVVQHIIDNRITLKSSASMADIVCFCVHCWYAWYVKCLIWMYNHISCTSWEPSPLFRELVNKSVKFCEMTLGECVHCEEKTFWWQEVVL